MKIIKKTELLVLCAVLLLTGCAGKSNKAYLVPNNMESFASGTVAENSALALSWDDESKCVFLTNKKTGYIWSTTPYGFYSSGETSYNLSSPIILEYYNPDDNSTQIAQSFSCIENGSVYAKTKDGVIKEFFFFKDEEITVGVTYALREDSLAVSINTSDIAESGKSKLISISLAPYLCSVKNSSDKSSYLFVPSGSGALMYTDDENDKEAREFSNEVYGYDMARTKLDNPGDEEAVRLPVFGASNGKDAILGIIESGDGAARIDASTGNTGYGYSNAGTAFYIRGFNNTEWESGVAFGSAVSNDIRTLNEEIPSGRELTVGFYPLSGDKANYNGMAERYRAYLNETNRIKKSDVKQKAYQINIVGGIQTDGLLLGIHYDKFLPLTTFDEAQSICSELKEKTGAPFSVQLKGFGKSGLNVGKIAGGFAFAKALGSSKNRQSFYNILKKSGIDVYMDFDIIRFSKSAPGYNIFIDSAKAADSETVYYFPLKKNIRVSNTEENSIRLLARSKITNAAEKLLKFCNKNISGVGLSTLGKFAYSDYRDSEYMVKGSLEKQASSIISSFKKSNHPVMLSAANAYAAGFADEITDVPLQNGGYYALDETIPFYEMIYGGSIPLYSESINISQNRRELLLDALAAGVSPSFTLSYRVNSKLSDTNDFDCNGILYESNLQSINETVTQTKAVYDKISGFAIKSYDIIGDGITKTVFENGVALYVNRSEKEFKLQGISVQANGFELKK